MFIISLGHARSYHFPPVSDEKIILAQNSLCAPMFISNIEHGVCVKSATPKNITQKYWTRKKIKYQEGRKKLLKSSTLHQN